MQQGRQRSNAQIANKRVIPARQWADVSRRNAQPVPQKVPESTPKSGQRSFDITFNFPSLSIASIYNKLRKILVKIPRRAWIIIGVVAIIAIASWGEYKSYIARQETNKVQISRSAPNLSRGTPNYKTVLPRGKDINALGGWMRVSPPDHNPVFAYTDKIGSAAIAVSQQPLPDDFKTDTDAQVAQLAANFKASQKVTLNNGTAIYIGTSTKGPQSVIFTKDNLLILVKSDVKIENDQWVQYVNSLI
jgi:hypothetical protein